MAPSGPVDHLPGLLRFVRAVCAGIACFVVGAVFVAHGSVQTFAEGAVGVGLALASLGVAARLVRHVRWREVAGVTAVALFLGSIFDGGRLPRRWL